MKINRVIALLMVSDVFYFTGFGLIDPILAIYMKEGLVGGSIFRAGVASTLFLLTKSLIQLPFSRYVDRHDDKMKWLLVGSGILLVVPIFYFFVQDIWTMFAIQIIRGVGAALGFPTWLGIWTAHIDKGHEAFEWSLYSTLTSLGAALTAVIGAFIAEMFGFRATLVFATILSFVGCAILFILNDEKSMKRKEAKMNYRKIGAKNNHGHR